MKIGIVTFWTTQDNYGQILQAYALQRFLRDKGHDAFIIRYNRAYRGFIWWLKLPLKLIKIIYWILFDRKTLLFNLKSRKNNKISKDITRLYPRNFDLFKEKYIRFSDKIYNRSDIMNNPPDADVFVAGSDQIWASLDSVFYLQFVPKGKKRIAYAPSFGGIQLNSRKKRLLKRYLSSFSVLAIREKEGVNLCKSLGCKDAFLTIDPTMLISKEEYSKIAVNSQLESDYLFLYLLGNEMDFDISKVYNWARTHQLKIKYVSSQGRIDCYEKIYPNIDEWLGLINNAKYIVTNSFHGMVFSLILNKKFLVIPLSGIYSRMNGRVFDLLSELELNDRIYVNDMNILSKNIDYDSINMVINKKKEIVSLMFNDWIK